MHHNADEVRLKTSKYNNFKRCVNECQYTHVRTKFALRIEAVENIHLLARFCLDV